MLQPLKARKKQYNFVWALIIQFNFIPSFNAVILFRIAKEKRIELNVISVFIHIGFISIANVD